MTPSESRPRSRWARILLFAALCLAGALLAGAVVFERTLLADLPDIFRVEDYAPPLTTRVVDREGRIIGEFFEQRRTLVSREAIPEIVKQAFVAGEDDQFYHHRGVDYVSILRAAWVNLRAGGQIKQGASTITQQTVKALLLSPERSFRRKIRELILARRLEQRLSKDEILYLYLNQIYFGHGAYGIGEAARTYFGKPVSQLTVSEAALLAGLPQRPSSYSPFRNPEAAETRRRYVLRRMYEEGYISESAFEEALAEPPTLRAAAPAEDSEVAAYFTEEVRRTLTERLGGERLRTGGLRIETTLDLDLQRAAVEALRRGLVAHDRRRGYRGPQRRVAPEQRKAVLAELTERNGLTAGGGPAALADASDRVLEGLVLEVSRLGGTARVAFAPGVEGRVRLETVRWARRPDPKRLPHPVRSIDRVFAPGDVASFRVIGGDAGGLPEVTLEQEPAVEGAVLAYDVEAGEVLALVGGYRFERSEFNRATQARRQPGSAFKPLVYAAALEAGFTPASIVVDRPVVYEDWRPENYGRKFLGRLTLREALARSVNNATIHLAREVGVGRVVDLAQRLGIASPLDRDLSLALGATEVHLAELTRAYAGFARGGRRLDPVFIRRVLDRNGEVVLENLPLLEDPPAIPEAALPFQQAHPELGGALEADRVMRPVDAFLVTSLLRAVVADPRGTGRGARTLGPGIVGKTGTTNEQADAWFVGYSPRIATGVWVGYDRKQVLGRGETGGRAALPIWVETMRAALERYPGREFPVPEGITFARIDARTGLLADATSEAVYEQPFASGTEPTAFASSDDASRVEERKRLRVETF